ncbi:PID-CTERM protein-sorting domain-containing protein [Pseudotamlana agarivorans]|uniref:PID-CTERM protein-sorting domain-containing protein n=1 Tax=Pseudotamlana agarivorans TaxID=481183 RepID=UPI000829A3B7|nr:hypothetical protein [Tamlana agarivorans]
MKYKTKSVFGLINMFAIMLAFSISTKTHATTTIMSSAPLDSNLSTLGLHISPIALTAVIGGDKDDRKDKDFSKRDKGYSGSNKGYGGSKGYGGKNKGYGGRDNGFGGKDKDKKNNGCPHYGKCSCGGNNTPPDSPPSVPIDGGLSLLALGAVALGIKKIRKEKNDKI